MKYISDDASQRLLHRYRRLTPIFTTFFCFDVCVASCAPRFQRGETPDSTSKGLKNLTDEFEIACAAMAKSVSKKGGQAEAVSAYNKAATILEAYLKGAELDPLGSDTYK